MEAITNKLPDVWFDWYARLIPGCVGLSIYLLGINYFQTIPDVSQIFTIMLLGYLIGHIFQPMSSFLVKKFEVKMYKNEDKYTEAKANPKIQPRSIRKVSKAHAEANSMFTCFLVCVPNIIFFCGQDKIFCWWIVGGMVYFLFMTWERAYSRNEKVLKLEKEASFVKNQSAEDKVKYS